MASTLEIGRMIIRLIGDSSHYERMLMQMQRQTQSASAAISKLGASITAGITVPIMAMGKASLDAFSEFDLRFKESLSIMNVTEDQINRLKNTAFELSSVLPRTPTDLAQSYFYLASAGYKAEEALALLPTLTRFAVAGAFDLERAATLAADAQSALGLRIRTGGSEAEIAAANARNLARVTDVLTKANILANANVRQFSIAITSQGGAAAKAFGKDIEEATAVLAAFADQGIKAELAGTNLSRVLRILSQTAIKKAAAHKQLGFQVFDTSGKMRNMADIVENLEQVLGHLSPKGKAKAMLKMGFEVRIQQAMLPLLGTSKVIRKYEDELRKAGGTTKEVADKQMEAFANQMFVVWNQVKIVAIEIGEILAPAFTFLAQGVTWATDAFRSLSPFVKSVLVVFGVIAAAIGPILLVIGSAAPVLSFLFATLSAGAAAIASFLAPVLLPMIAGIWLVIGAFTVLSIYLGGVEKAWEFIKKEAVLAFEEIKYQLKQFAAFMWPVWQALKSLAVTVWEVITNAVTIAVDTAIDLLSDLQDWGIDVWNSLGISAKVNWTNIRDFVRDSILFMEFSIRNFGMVVDYVWTGMRLGWLIIVEEFKFFFTGTLPATLSWFRSTVVALILWWVAANISAQETISRNFTNRVSYMMGYFSRNWKALLMWIPVATIAAFGAVFKWIFSSWGTSLTSMGSTWSSFSIRTPGILINNMLRGFMWARNAWVSLLNDMMTQWFTTLIAVAKAPYKLLGAAYKWISSNWGIVLKLMLANWTVLSILVPKIFTASFNSMLTTSSGNTRTMFRNMVNNIVSVFKAMPSLMSGKATFEKLWTPMKDKFDDKWKGIKTDFGDLKLEEFKLPELEKIKLPGFKLPEFKLPDRDMGVIDALKREFEEKGKALGESFEKFRKRRLEEWAAEGIIPPVAAEQLLKDSRNLGEDAGEDLADGMASGLQDLDNVLFASAEARRRLEKYRQMMDIVHGGAALAKRNEFVGKQNQPAGREPQVELLRDIRDILEERGRVPGLEIDVAGLV